MAPSTFWNFTFMDIVTALLTLLAIVVALWVALFTLKQNNRFHYETIKANFSLIIKIYGTSSYICLQNVGSSEATITDIYWNCEVLNKTYNVGISANKELWEASIFSHLQGKTIAGKQKMKYKIDFKDNADDPIYRGDAFLTIIYNDIKQKNLTKILVPFIDGSETSNSKSKPNGVIDCDKDNNETFKQIKDILEKDF